MADNVAVTAGSGTTIATDDVAGSHYQRVKLTDGTADSSTAIAAGGGVESGALRVTIASDSTGVVSVDDNGSTLSIDDGGSTVSVDDGGGSLTVDGTVSAKLQDGAGTAITSATRGAEQALSVQIVNAAGTQITSFGGGTQYTEDGASAGGESLTLAGAVRRDTVASSATTDGDYATINTDSVGRLWVNATLSNSAGANIIKAGDSVSDPSHNGLIPLVVRKDTPATIADTDGDYEMLQASGGRLWTSAVVTAATTSIGKAEDVASANADVGVPAMAVRKGSPENTSGTDGDYEFLQMSNGRLWTSSHMTDVNGATVVSQTNAVFSDPANGILALTVRKDAPATISDGDGDYEVMQSSGGRLWASSQVYGEIAHDAADSGNPIKVGGYATAPGTYPTAVSSGDRSRLITDLFGRPRVIAERTDVKTLGVYYWHSGILTLNASADGAASAGGGRLWIINPTGSGVKVRIRRISFRSQMSTALVAVTCPRITIEKSTYTGTPSGGTLTPTKRKAEDAAKAGSVRTANTGMTIAASTDIATFVPVSSATAVAYSAPAIDVWAPGEDEWIELAELDCVVIRQADAGTTSDTRKFFVDIVTEEY